MSAMLAAVKIGIFYNLDNDQKIFNSDKLTQKLNELMMKAVDTEESRGLTYVLKNKECKRRFSEKTKCFKSPVLVVYRATPDLKHKFTCALRQSKANLAVTGKFR